MIEERKAHPEDRLILALDMDSEEKALEMVRFLSGWVTTFKVGSQLYTACGPDVVRRIREAGGRVFLDLKFHDIPSTVAKAGIEAARLGVFMFNVHVSGGGTMIQRCVETVSETCEREGLIRPFMIGVTLLTSICEETLRDDIGVARPIPDQVVHFARLAREEGLDGVVASARDVPRIREACGKDFLIVTPGIRPAGAALDDQSRVATPAHALEYGADYLVVGRPVTAAPDPGKEVRRILEEIRGVTG